MIRVLLRSYGGENMKDRPAYYGKLLCLQSMVDAASAAGLEIVYLNDGPVPAERLELMKASGEVIELPGVGLRGSYLAALSIATSGRWADDDVVWFGEDDYLYRPDAFTALDAAATALGQATYFGLYAPTTQMPIVGEGEAPATFPAHWQELPAWTVGDHEWVRILSTTSSFGARVGALREDIGVFKFCMVPHRTMLRDHDTGLVCQGFEPYTWGSVLRDAVLATPGDLRGRLREAAMAPFRAATNLRSHRRDHRRRLFVAPQPNLATHMEASRLAPGTDWDAVAAAVASGAPARTEP